MIFVCIFKTKCSRNTKNKFLGGKTDYPSKQIQENSVENSLYAEKVYVRRITSENDPGSML
jgi:hypothetical protein